MKPRTSLFLSLGILLVTFVGARLYVGSQLDQFKEQQSELSKPNVNIVTTPSKPPPPPAPAREPTPAERAASDVSGAFGAFTTLVEVEGDERDESVAAALIELEGLTKPTMLAVPPEMRPILEAELESIGESLPADALVARRAFHAKRVELLEAWGSDASNATAELNAVNGGTAP